VYAVLLFTIIIAIALFVIWSTMLLMIFTVAFSKAARLARQSWQEADAATKSG
jgi:1,4-dihydroxy-2-naphthoate octaprenyltransferase